MLKAERRVTDKKIKKLKKGGEVGGGGGGQKKIAHSTRGKKLLLRSLHLKSLAFDPARALLACFFFILCSLNSLFRRRFRK